MTYIYFFILGYVLGLYTPNINNFLTNKLNKKQNDITIKSGEYKC